MPGGLSCWTTTNVYQMIIKPGGTHTSNTQLTMAGGSDNTDEDSDQEEQPATPWNELSIVERVGLNSMQLPEEELESAFAQIALAFRCDQYTLKQRLQAEEHARNLAEENVQLELTRGRETLETLKDLCLDSKRSKILQSLELSLDILGGTVERIANTAEQLGAVHQEARVCRAVEIMVAHMEHLKRRHDRDVTELEESKKLVHRVSRRHLLEPRVQPDADEVDAKAERKSAQHFNGRRRVSVSVISKETQEKRKRDLRKQMSQGDCPSPMPSSAFGYSPPMKDGNDTFDGRLLVDPGATWSGSSALQLDPSPIPEPERPPPPAPPKEEATRKTLNNNLPLDNLRQRHRGKAALSKRKTEKDKKSVTRYRQLSLGLCGLAMRRPPQTPWLHRHRWVLPCTLFLLLLLLCIAACSCGSSKVENSEDLIGVKSN